MAVQKGVDFTGVTVVFLCHDGQGNILLSKRSTQCRDEHGTWDPGGGSIEFGDHVEDTLRREIAKECCTPDALPSPLHSQFPGFIEQYREKLESVLK